MSSSLSSFGSPVSAFAAYFSAILFPAYLARGLFSLGPHKLSPRKSFFDARLGERIFS